MRHETTRVPAAQGTADLLGPQHWYSGSMIWLIAGLVFSIVGCSGTQSEKPPDAAAPNDSEPTPDASADAAPSDATLTEAADDAGGGGTSTDADAGDTAADGAGAPPDGRLRVDGVQGTIADGVTLTIQALAGEDFGDVGPPIAQVWDQFAGAAPSDDSRLDTPYLGTWDVAGHPSAAGSHSDYVATPSLSRGMAWQGFTQDTSGTVSLRANRMQMKSPEKERECFMSSNLFVPVGGWGPESTYVDAEGWPAASFAKLYWIEDGPKGGSEPGAWDMLGAGILDRELHIPASGNEGVLNSQSGEFPAWTRSHDLKTFWDHSRWHVLQYGFQEPSPVYGSVPGAFARVGVQGQRTVWTAHDTSGSYSPFEPMVTDSFDHIAVPAYIRTQNKPTTQPRQLFFDDIYLALGPGAMCRVELHDTEDDSAASVVAIQPVAHGDWNASEIAVTLRFNDLVPASPVGWWIKVYGRDGSRLSARQIK